jgi:hypothetical protein
MEATDKWLPSIMTQASAGDHFFFVGIEFPHQYVLWAEERLDQYKREELDKVSNVDSTIVVQLDKVRINQLQDEETTPLLDSLRVGSNIKVADFRFIKSPHEMLHLQSITYTWDASTIMLPNVEVVLSNDVVKYSNPISNIQNNINEANDNIRTLHKTSQIQLNTAKKTIRKQQSEIKTLSTGSSNIHVQMNILTGNDKLKSVREIAKDVVINNMPTEIAPSTPRILDLPEIILPNILYDTTYQSISNLTFPQLVNGDDNYANKWMFRFSGYYDTIMYPYDIHWKDGIAPTWEGYAYCDITLSKNANDSIIFGEWKIYK